jgi:transcriptional regulator with XRE-family HTH domain
MSRGGIVFFQRLEDLRIDHDMTQQEVADLLGCNREVYRRYEKGIRTIPIDFLIQLADYYQVSIDYIVGRSKHR